MDVPVDPAPAAGAAVALLSSGPWRLVELSAGLQDVMRPILRHAPPPARLAGVAIPGAAKASRTKEPIAPAGVIARDYAGCVATRAGDVELKAVARDVADGLEWKRAKHACDVERGRP